MAKPSSRWKPGHNPQDHRRKVFVAHTIRGKTRWMLLLRNGKRIQWSRVVIENELGRYLRPEEVVHHINGDSSDDRSENLQLFANHAAHMRAEHEAGLSARMWITRREKAAA